MTLGKTVGVDQPLWKRLFWFVALWVAGVASVMVVSFALRTLIV
ncbi:Protein of unknown function [Pseudovibrio sp. Tun.PSC04-5.I4]|nr:DUF2474 family protein [Pseudovibrio sp. Tun.PSC04-5.I4]SDQ77070.1 Protein of unknown function [Pseudovibrio sp. Tun.PSC04-5.I4]